MVSIGDVCKTALQATKQLRMTKENIVIRCYLLRHATLFDLSCGEFDIAEARMKENVEMVSKVLDPNDHLMMLVYNNVAQAAASKCHYEDSLNWWGECEAIFEQRTDHWPEAGIMININTARSYYCLGQYEESKKRLEEALRYAQMEDSPYFDAQ